MKRQKTIMCDSGGIFAEIYTDDDDGSGYGDNPMSAKWYGTQEECENLDPYTVDLVPVIYSNLPDELDIACERRYD
tara:strand:+ start:1009 stop:1236 length:228 start_codon:yes stop_codon:yes gene_type:complete